MDNFKDLLEGHNREVEIIKDAEGSKGYIYSIRSRRGRDVKVAHIFTEEGVVSTIISGLTRSIPFYKKIEVLEYINKKNGEDSDIKYRLSEDSRLIFSISRNHYDIDNVDLKGIIEDRRLMMKCLDDYTELDFIEERFSKKKDLSSLLNFNKEENYKDTIAKIKEYLKSMDIFSIETEDNDYVKLRFKIVNSNANARDAEVFVNKDGNNHKVVLKNIFGSIPEQSVISTLEAVGNMNDKHNDIKFIFIIDNNSFDLVYNFSSDNKKIEAQRIYKDILYYSDLAESEYKDYIKFMTDTVSELLIETPEASDY